MEQTREPMDKNRIRGSHSRTSGREVAKSISVKGNGSKSGGCARKAVELTPGDLHRVPPQGGTKEVGRRMTAVQKSAEGIVGGGLPATEGPNGPRKGLNGAAIRTRIS